MNKKYLALGDSYTIGEGLVKGQRFPDYLANLLGKEFSEPEVIAVTGWTTAELLEGIEVSNLSGRYDLVTLLIGVNNQYRGQTTEQYSDEFTELIELALGFADNNPKHVVVVSIPDWGKTPFAADRNVAQIELEIDLFNAINQQISLQFEVNYVDVTELSRMPNVESMLVSDRLHYSEEMYYLWAKKIYKQIVDFISD